MKRAVIIGSAPVSDWSFLQRWVTPEAMIICADGGLVAAHALGLTADWYVGDSDSGGYTGHCPADVLPSEKDVTDLDMAVSRAIREGYEEIVLCGCTGGREDHHLSAIGQLERIHRLGAEGVLVDEYNEIRLLYPGVHTIKEQTQFHYFGLIPLDAMLTGVTITGAKYEVTNQSFCRWESLGVSNQPLPGRDCVVCIGSGMGLLILSN